MKRDEKTGQLLPGSGGRPKGTRNKLTADFLSDAIPATARS